MTSGNRRRLMLCLLRGGCREWGVLVVRERMVRCVTGGGVEELVVERVPRGRTCGW